MLKSNFSLEQICRSNLENLKDLHIEIKKKN